MLNTIFTYLKEGSVYYGLEISEGAGGIDFHMLEIKRKRQELTLGAEQTYSNIEEALASMKKGAPLFLILNTTKVITKIDKPWVKGDEEEAVHKAFPNLDFNSFYYTLVKTDENSLISICKRNNLDTYLENLLELKVNVVDVCLGVSVLTTITDYLPDGDIYISNGRLELKKKSIKKINPFTKVEGSMSLNYEMNDLTLTSSSLLGFSSVLGHILKRKETHSNFEAVLLSLGSEFTHKRYFSLMFKYSLVFVLIVLFLNFLVFNHYYQEVGNIQETLAVNNVDKDRVIALSKSVKIKEERVNAILLASNSRTSFYLDHIAKNIPASILLSEVQYQPLKKTIRTQRTIEVSKNLISIAGAVNNSDDFYSWIETLEKSSWVSNVETTNYDYDSNNSSHFSLNLYINE